MGAPLDVQEGMAIQRGRKACLQWNNGVDDDKVDVEEDKEGKRPLLPANATLER